MSVCYQCPNRNPNEVARFLQLRNEHKAQKAKEDKK